MSFSKRTFPLRVACLALAASFAVAACYEGKVDPPVTPKTATPIAVDPAAPGDPAPSAPAPGEPAPSPPAPGEPGPSDPCAGLAFTYEASVAPLSQARCDRCHGNGGSFPNLKDKAGWTANIESIVKRIKGKGPLMPLGGPKLPEDQLIGVENWSKCDFP